MPNGKFRLAYVGSVENFYGRVLFSLIKTIEPMWWNQMKTRQGNLRF
jgi:hypothetical protein